MAKKRGRQPTGKKIIGSITLYPLSVIRSKTGISLVSLRLYLRTGQLKGRKAGGYWYVTEDSLREFFETRAEPQPVKKRKRDRPVVV